MGGYGSTRWAGYQRKTWTETQPVIDIRQLSRDRNLTPGREFRYLTRRGAGLIGEIRGCALTDCVALCWLGHWTQIGVRHTPTAFGGTRPWFECPLCLRRAALLFPVAETFGCRKCAGLGFRSQLSEPSVRGVLQALRLRLTLGASSSISEPLPSRPRRMRRKTYFHILDRVTRLEDAWMDSLIHEMARLSGQDP